jgi:hypothetical protein
MENQLRKLLLLLVLFLLVVVVEERNQWRVTKSTRLSES